MKHLSFRIRVLRGAKNQYKHSMFICISLSNNRRDYVCLELFLYLKNLGQCNYVFYCGCLVGNVASVIWQSLR